MLKKDKNLLLSVIERQGLDPLDFEASEEILYDAPAFTLSLRDSPFQFTVHVAESDYDSFTIRRTLFAPGWPLSDWEPDSGFVMQLGSVVARFEEWLVNVERYREDLDAPNYWEELHKAQSTVDDIILSEDDANRQFAPQERRAIESALAEIRGRLLSQYEISEGQLTMIDDRLDYLADAAARLGRTDWRNILVSTIMAIILTLHLDTRTGEALYRLIADILAEGLKLLQ